MIRLYLLIAALCFIAFGLWSFADPLGMTAQLGVDVSGPNGAFEMRGIYGGVSLGAGLLSLAGALRAEMRRPALWFLVAYMGGYCFARLAALAFGPAPTADFWTFVAFEAVMLIGAVLSLRALPAPK